MNQQHWTRRDCLRAASAGAFGALVASAKSSLWAADESPIHLDMAGYKYDRVAALVDGRVKVEGCDVDFEMSSIGEMNTHVFSGPKSREVTEIGLSPYMHAFANDGFRDYVLIPVFPLRLFRHKSIFIRTDRGIEKPQDLRGKKVATPGYSSTSLTWIRGIMQHEYGVRPEEIKWIVSAQDSSSKFSGNPSKQENVLPKGIAIAEGPKGKDESDLLADGDVDALFHAVEPRAYIEGHPKVARLFPDYRKVERAYFARTRIFPIMHAVAIRRDVAAKHPWLPKAVFQAYSKAKQEAYKYLNEAAWLKTSLPWIGQEVEETKRLMGDNFYSYGIGPNRKTLEALFRYSHEQGLASRRLTIEEMFLPQTLDLKEELG